MKEHLILDFNDPSLEFKARDIAYLNLSSIYKNIDKFNEFAYQITATEIFDIIFNSTLFQVSLANTDNSIDDLLLVYNMIANEGLINNKKYPTLLKKTFIKLMKAKGFIVKRTRKAISPYVYENKSYFIKVVK